MARKRKGGNNYSVSVDGLSELAAIPGWLDDGQRAFLEKASDRLADAVRAKAPGGAHGSIGRDVESRTLSPTTAVVRSKGSKAAKALDQGAYIRAKRGVAIRFTVGGRVVFIRKPRGSRIKARHFYKAGLRSRGKVVRQAYSEAFSDLHRYRHGGG